MSSKQNYLWFIFISNRKSLISSRIEQIPSRDDRTFWKTASLPKASDRISLIKLIETDLSLVAVVSMFESRLSFCKKWVIV